MKQMLFWAAMATMVMTSCSKNEPIENTKNEAIGFGTYVGLSTKGADADLATLKGTGFTVNGYFTETDWATSGTTATPNIMHQTAVRHSVSDGWAYSPLAYWPQSGKVTFFANSTHTAVTAPSAATVAGVPSFTFTAPDAAANQIDLLAAVALNRAKDDNPSTVNFAFNHILSKIGFTAALSAEPSAGTVVKVTGLTVNYKAGTVKNSGVYTHAASSTAVGTWALGSTYHTDASAGDVIKTGGVDLDVTANLTPAVINDATKSLMIVPQTLAAAGDMSVEITYTVKVGAGAELTYTKTANIPAKTVFDPKTSYLFNIVMNLNSDAITFGDPTIGGWEDGGSITI